MVNSIREHEYHTKEFEIELKEKCFTLSFHWRANKLHHLRLTKVMRGLPKSYDIYIEEPMYELAALDALIAKAKDECEKLGLAPVHLEGIS